MSEGYSAIDKENLFSGYVLHSLHHHSNDTANERTSETTNMENICIHQIIMITLQERRTTARKEYFRMKYSCIFCHFQRSLSRLRWLVCFYVPEFSGIVRAELDLASSSSFSGVSVFHRHRRLRLSILYIAISSNNMEIMFTFHSLFDAIACLSCIRNQRKAALDIVVVVFFWYFVIFE